MAQKKYSKIKRSSRKGPITIDMWIAIIVMTSVILSLFNIPEPVQKEAEKTAEMPSISTEGLDQVSVRMQFNDLIFSSKCRSLSMTIADTQALSISHSLQNTTYVRPLTHEIIRNAFENFGIEVPFVKIDEYEDGIYKAKIFMKKNNQILEMDARPSDAVGVAVRVKSSVYFNHDLMERFGTYTC
jgi:bifunctional DNase/RNase